MMTEPKDQVGNVKWLEPIVPGSAHSNVEFVELAVH